MNMKTAISFRTFADVLNRLGNISPDRVRFDLKPGRATVRDLVNLHGREDRLFELVDGFLVEKAMGLKESYLAVELIRYFGKYLESDDRGFILGPDGTMEIMPNLVRLPDVCFISWLQRPDHTIPNEPVPNLFPDLAVEVLSESNTPKEMERKLMEYFASGCQMVWFIDPRSRTATMYTSPEESVILKESESLDGGDVLPGFKLPLKKLFARLEPSARKRKKIK